MCAKVMGWEHKHHGDSLRASCSLGVVVCQHSASNWSRWVDLCILVACFSGGKLDGFMDILAQLFAC